MGQATEALQRIMPDVANHLPAPVGGTLDRVGMSGIEIPVQVAIPGQGVQRVPARADAYVDLRDPEAKGIHMSRLFLRLHEHLPEAELSIALLRSILAFFTESHADRSSAAYLSLSFEVMFLRPSLLSDNSGYRSYPVTVHAGLTPAGFSVVVSTQVAYSSTCPCSAALARQLIQEQFDADFAGQAKVDVAAMRAWLGRPESICATPHSQRSYASIDARLAEGTPLDLVGIIDTAECSLQTVVQAAVKREDEQEFARLNGRNLMFCEDASRRLKAAFERQPGISDFRIEARHVESLHPHDAVAVAVKGVPGGMTA